MNAVARRAPVRRAAGAKDPCPLEKRKPNEGRQGQGVISLALLGSEREGTFGSQWGAEGGTGESPVEG